MADDINQFHKSCVIGGQMRLVDSEIYLDLICVDHVYWFSGVNYPYV